MVLAFSEESRRHCFVNVAGSEAGCNRQESSMEKQMYINNHRDDDKNHRFHAGTFRL